MEGDISFGWKLILAIGASLLFLRNIPNKWSAFFSGYGVYALLMMATEYILRPGDRINWDVFIPRMSSYLGEYAIPYAITYALLGFIWERKDKQSEEIK